MTKLKIDVHKLTELTGLKGDKLKDLLYDINEAYKNNEVTFAEMVNLCVHNILPKRFRHLLKRNDKPLNNGENGCSRGFNYRRDIAPPRRSVSSKAAQIQ